VDKLKADNPQVGTSPHVTGKDGKSYPASRLVVDLAQRRRVENRLFMAQFGESFFFLQTAFQPDLTGMLDFRVHEAGPPAVVSCQTAPNPFTRRAERSGLPDILLPQSHLRPAWRIKPMPKKKPASKNVVHKPRPENEDEIEYFRRFLAAADRVALELLVREGVMSHARAGSLDYFYSSALDELAKEFGRDWESTSIDDVVHFTEAEVKYDAAHMIGLALGLRLRGVDLGLSIGGVR
jgi:hypothetical protein